MRFFKQLFTRGADGTALKILYKIVDLQHAGIFGYTSHGAVDSFEDEWKYRETDRIENQKKLVSTLSAIITKLVDYKKYQALPSEEKEKFKNNIATILSNVSKDYDVNYTKTIEDHYPTKFTGKGLRTSLFLYFSDKDTQMDGDIWTPTTIHFPTGLFEDDVKLAQCVRAAIQADFSDLLKDNQVLNCTL